MTAITAAILAMSMHANPFACMTVEAEEAAKSTHWAEVQALGESVFQIEPGE